MGRLATLLAVGCWPGSLRAGTRREVEEVHFVAANDFHHQSPACDSWFEQLFRQIGAHPDLAFTVGLGDLADLGLRDSLASIARASGLIGVPFYATPGNHDNAIDGTSDIYAEIFPGRLNYTWAHGGWQFVAIDTTEGKKWNETVVSAGTLAWLDATLPTLDRESPTLLFTHFPLAEGVRMCPLNAEDVLARFVEFNLQGVFSGHFHSQTAETRHDVVLVTNVCCSRVVNNHDGTTRKGYWLCKAKRDGTVERSFVEFCG